MPEAFRMSAAGLDLSGRLFRTSTVVASPAAAAETIIGSLTIADDLGVAEGVLLWASFGYTVGTAGVSVLPRIRRTNVAGTAIKTGAAQTAVATNLHNQEIMGFDTGPTLPNQVYVLTIIVASATAETTVSTVDFVALVI